MAEKERMTAEQVVAYLMEEDGADFLRESLRFVVEALMEAEVSELIGADPRRAHARPGDAPQRLSRSRAGTRGPASSSCASPSCARAATSRSFLEPRRRSEQALLAVVQQAYVCGVSTRRVDQLVESLGLQDLALGGVADLRPAGRAGAGVP